MKSRALMLQGTGSNVGKSVLVAGLCRLAANRGIKVAPFKPQNMSNNAAVCADGGEIGRAQALQAMACRIEPRVDFNPVLLKPQSDERSQLIVRGKVAGAPAARQLWGEKRGALLPEVLGSFQHLQREFELVIVEGAGSPAETNLRQGDIANMGFATAADVPVCLVADIDRGGVIASVVGTKSVLDSRDQSQICGFMINKFRGDPTLFTEGYRDIESRTNWRGFGVIPWLKETALLPQEDAVPLEHADTDNNRQSAETLRVVAPVLSRIANFDDLDPLRQEPGVSLEFVLPGSPIPLDADAVILLGSKSALAEMRFLRDQGWDTDICALHRAGRHILGICGGLQLLGNQMIDTDGVDGPSGVERGLGLLDISTSMHPVKTVRENSGEHVPSGATLKGYEIHVGKTDGPDAVRPFAQLVTGPDGARNPAGNVTGTYLHGLFANDAFRQYWLNDIKPGTSSELNYNLNVDQALDQLAASLEAHLDVDDLIESAR